MEKLSVNIKLIRDDIRRRGISLTAFAREMGMERDTLYKIFQRRRAGLGNIEKIAEALHRSPKDLLI
jgi:lambda repressor-like predicted transcriptional regulator